MDSPLGPDDKMVEMPDAFVGTCDAFALADIANSSALAARIGS